MEQKNFQRLTVYLKGGQILNVDFNATGANKLNPQIELLIKSIGEPKAQEKVIVFEGQRLIGIRVSEVAAYEVLPLVLTQKTEVQSNEESVKQ